MGPFRFLHVADVHLDTPFLSREEALRRRLRDAARDAFRAAVDLALEKRVHAFLIAGDLADHDRIRFATERFLTEQWNRLHEAGIPVFYACGNHDPGSPQSRLRDIPWPPTATVFWEPEPRSVPVRTPDGQTVGIVTGAGHSSPRESQNVVASFARAAGALPPNAPGLPHVGLVHAWVQGASGRDDHDRYAPCGLTDLERAGKEARIHYWALGHIHQRQQVATVPFAFYPGNLQGRHFRETGAKGALLVELYEDGGAQVDFVPLAPVRWETVTLSSLKDVTTMLELQETMAAACRSMQANSEYRCQWLWRIELQGPCPLAHRFAEPDTLRELEEALAQELDALHVEVRAADVRQPVDPAAYQDGIHPLAVALRLLEQARHDDDLLDQLTPVLSEPHQWGNTGEEGRRAYVRELLAGLEEEAVARLVDPTAAPSG